MRHRWWRPTFLTLVVWVIAWSVGFYWHPLWFYDRVVDLWLRIEGARSHDVQLGAYRIHYRDTGAGRPIVLVHGLGGHAEDWAYWIPKLKRLGYRVYALDLLGFGRSDRPPIDYTIALQTDILRQFFDSQHIAQADLGGWSMGGWIALKFTLDHPERVHRLFVCDSAGIYFEPAWAPQLFSARTPEELNEFMAILTPHRVPIPNFVARDLIRQMARQKGIVQATLASTRTGRERLDGELARIGEPVLILWGREDATTPLAGGVEMHREMPQSILAIFDGCGHLAPVECGDRMVPETIRFLKADPPLPGGMHEFPPARN